MKSNKEEDLNALTIAVLKARCREAGLPQSGKKADLIARLQEAGGEAKKGGRGGGAAAAAPASAEPAAAAAAAAAPEAPLSARRKAAASKDGGPPQAGQAVAAPSASAAPAAAPAARDALARLKELGCDEAAELAGACADKRRLLSPFEIHFSQSHIRPEFQDGRLVDDTVAEVQRELLRPLGPEQVEAGGDCPLLIGAPTGSDNWWLLRPPFPEIEVIEWRIKLREEDGTPKLDENGMELYGQKEWYTLDNRRLYCLQKAATAGYPTEVRCIVSVIQQEDGNAREFRKFRTSDGGRTVGVGHRDSVDLPRWSWRREVGLAEEVFTGGATISKPRRRVGPNCRGGPPSSGRGARRSNDEDSSKWDFMSNVSFFLIVYLALRLLFHLSRRALVSWGMLSAA